MNIVKRQFANVVENALRLSLKFETVDSWRYFLYISSVLRKHKDGEKVDQHHEEWEIHESHWSSQ